MKIALDRYFLNSHIFIAICAAIAYTQSFILSAGQSPDYSKPIITGLLTFIFYQAHSVFDRMVQNSNNTTGHNSQLNPILSIFAITVLSIVFFLNFRHFNTFDYILLFTCALICASYLLPIPILHKRFRDIWYFKIFLITFCWVAITSIWPLLSTPPELHVSNFLNFLLVAERSLLIFTLCLLFDIRDVSIDSQQGTKTIALKMGVQNTKRLATILFALFLPIKALVIYFSGISNYTILGLLVFGVLGVKIIRSTTLAKPSLFYSGCVDGLILLDGLFVLFSYCYI